MSSPVFLKPSFGGLPNFGLCCIIPIVRGLSSVVECLLAKEKVKGSNPLARSRRRSQVVRQGSAKALFVGSIPTVASLFHIDTIGHLSGMPVCCPGKIAGRWRNGRRRGLKILCSKERVGSTPTRPIKNNTIAVLDLTPEIGAENRAA